MNPNPNPNPNTNPPPTDPYYSCYSQNPNTQFSLQHLHHVYTDPSAAAAASTTTIRPPGVDSYPSLTSLPQPNALSYVQADASAYYLDPNLQIWAAKEAVQQYGANPAGYGGAVVSEQLAHPESIVWANLAFQLQGNGTLKKRQKKTKVVQSAYCEVCKVDCNSKEVLEKHKLGKKHRKNLEKLQVAAAGPSTSSVSRNLIIGPQEDPNKGKVGNGQRGKKKAAAPAEDLETKRRKVVEGGAAAEAVRVCAICNVVCNSENVYNYHLTGRKHAAMLKRHGLRMVAAS